MATRGRGVQTQTEEKTTTVDPFAGFFSGIFGTPTVKKAPTPTPQVATTPSYIPPPPKVPTGQIMQAQSNPRGQSTPTTSQKTYCMIVYGQKMQLNSDAINWYIDRGVDVRPCGETTPTPTATGSDLSDLESRVARLEQYPQVTGTASQKSDQDIWDHLDEHVWGHTGNQNAIYPQLQKAIAEHGEFHTKFQELGDALQSGYEHRTGLEQKIDAGIAEHADFHTKLENLGVADVSAKEHRDSIEAKLEEQRKHTHTTGGGNGNGGDCNCEWYDIGCKWNCGWEKYGTIIMIVGGLIGLGILLWLLRPLFSVLGMFSRGSP
jgi:hypothetical protein